MLSASTVLTFSFTGNSIQNFLLIDSDFFFFNFLTIFSPFCEVIRIEIGVHEIVFYPKYFPFVIRSNKSIGKCTIISDPLSNFIVYNIKNKK